MRDWVLYQEQDDLLIGDHSTIPNIQYLLVVGSRFMVQCNVLFVTNTDDNQTQMLALEA